MRRSPLPEAYPPLPEKPKHEALKCTPEKRGKRSAAGEAVHPAAIAGQQWRRTAPQGKRSICPGIRQRALSPLP